MMMMIVVMATKIFALNATVKLHYGGRWPSLSHGEVGLENTHRILRGLSIPLDVPRQSQGQGGYCQISKDEVGILVLSVHKEILLSGAMENMNG